MKCAIKCVKCVTDRAVGAINCVGIPIATVIIVGKNYQWGVLKTVEWGLVVLPAIILVLFNIFYCTLCNMLLVSGRIENEYGSVV